MEFREVESERRHGHVGGTLEVTMAVDGGGGRFDGARWRNP